MGPKGGGPEGGPKGGGPQISRFFFPLSRRKIRSFLPSLGVFSLNFGGVFEDWDPQMCTFGLSGTRPGRRGSHTTARELQTCTFERPGASNTTKIPRKGPTREGEKNKNCGGRRKKKRKILGPHRSGPTLRGPTPSGPLGLAPHKKKFKKNKQSKITKKKNFKHLKP